MATAPTDQVWDSRNQIKMSDQELDERIKTDPGFSLSFAVNNNFPELRKKFQELGFTVNTQEEGFNLLKIWTQRGAVQLLNYVLDVPYNNAAPNSTGGYRDYFASRNPPSAAGRADFSWGGLLSALGAGLGVYANAAMGATPSPGVGMTPEQIAAAAEAEKKKKEEEERKKKILTYSIGGGSALLLLIGIIFIFTRPKTQANDG